MVWCAGTDIIVEIGFLLCNAFFRAFGSGEGFHRLDGILPCFISACDLHWTLFGPRRLGFSACRRLIWGCNGPCPFYVVGDVDASVEEESMSLVTMTVPAKGLMACFTFDALSQFQGRFQSLSCPLVASACNVREDGHCVVMVMSRRGSTSSSCSDWLELMQQQACGILLSGMALCLASLLRLLLYGCWLKGGVCNFDPGLRVARRVVRGAPYSFWMVFLVMMVGTGAVAVKVGPPSGSGSELQASLDRADRIIQMEMLIHNHSNVVGSAEFLEVPFADAVSGDMITGTLPDPAPERRIPIRVVQFQKSDFYMSVLAAEGIHNEELLARAASTLISDEHFHMFDCYPQPETDVVVVGVAPRWWRDAPFVPVFIDAEAVHRGLGMVCLPRTCGFEELREAFFSYWPPESVLIFEGSIVPFQAGQEIRPTEGSLFRVYPRAAHIDRVYDLGLCLENLEWMRDVEEDGMPPDPSGGGRLLVLGPDHAFVLGATDALTFPQIQRQLAIVLQEEAANLVVFLPRAPLNSLAYKGKAVAGVVAVDRKQGLPTHSGCGIFVDCRDFGIEVSFQLFATKILSADDFAAALEFDPPPGYLIVLEGFDFAASSPGHFVFSHGAVATLWLERDNHASTGEDSPDEGMRVDPENDISDGPGDGHHDDGPPAPGSSAGDAMREPSPSDGASRSRSPRRRSGEHHCDEPTLGYDAVPLVLLPIVEFTDVDMWTCASNEDAVPDCLCADTSVLPGTSELQTALEHSDPSLREAWLGSVSRAWGGQPDGVPPMALAPHSEVPTTIFLEDLVFPAEPILEADFVIDRHCRIGTAPVPWTDDMDCDLWRFAAFSALRDPPDDVESPGRFGPWVARSGGIKAPPGPHEALVISSDGSFSDHSGAGGWGLVFARDCEHVDPSSDGYFLGCSWGVVADLCDILGCAGPPLNPYLAEMAGLFWAGVAVLQLRYTGKVVFQCDCQPALFGACGQCAIQEHPICRATRGIHLGLFSRLREVPIYMYSPGHVGIASNEMADGIACRAVKLCDSTKIFQLDPAVWKKDGADAFADHP